MAPSATATCSTSISFSLVPASSAISTPLANRRAHEFDDDLTFRSLTTKTIGFDTSRIETIPQRTLTQPTLDKHVLSSGTGGTATSTAMNPVSSGERVGIKRRRLPQTPSFQVETSATLRPRQSQTSSIRKEVKWARRPLSTMVVQNPSVCSFGEREHQLGANRFGTSVDRESDCYSDVHR